MNKSHCNNTVHVQHELLTFKMSISIKTGATVIQPSYAENASNLEAEGLQQHDTTLVSAKTGLPKLDIRKLKEP